MVATWVIGTWVHIVMHELGHALAGELVGVRLLVLGVGPWRVQRDAGGAWHWQRGHSVAGLGGFAASAPMSGRTPSRAAESFVLLGGVGMNALLVLLALAVWWWLPLNGWVRLVLEMFCLVGVLLVVFNLLPIKTKGWHSDGYILRKLWQGGADARLLQQLRQLQGLIFAGVRPRDWPMAWLPDGASVSDIQPRMQAEMMCLLHAVDQDDSARALGHVAWLAQHYHQQPDGMRQVAAVSAAGTILRFAPQLALLQAWRKLCDGSVLPIGAYLAHVDAGIAWLQGDLASARSHLQHARELLPTSMTDVEKITIGEALDVMQQRIEDAASASPLGQASAGLPLH